MYFQPILFLFTSFNIVYGEIPQSNRIIMRILTMNTWHAGQHVENGFSKIAKHIKALNADVVLLQEMNAKAFDHKPAIITKHKIIANTKFFTNWTFGLTIFQDSGITLNVVNMHLNYRNYGPTLVENAKTGVTAESILADDFQPQGRLQNFLELSSQPSFKKFLAQTSEVPLILAGDFNEPSHLDWTNKTCHLHKGFVMEWPVTKYLSEKHGLVDTFRQLRPNVLETPGRTWSSVWDEAFEPSDRIDFIFYKSDQLKPVQSFTYSGLEALKKLPEKDRWVGIEELEERDWSSDHYAVVTDFVMDNQFRPRYVGDRWNGCNVKENGTIILENACKRNKILILCYKSNKATGQNSKVSRRFRSKIGLYWEGLFDKCAGVMGHKEWHGLIIDKMADGKVAFESSLRFGGFFANDLINKTVAFHIFSKADTLLENDFQMALRLGAFMDDFDGMALRILALDLVSVTEYIGCQMMCSLPNSDGTEPTTLAFNTPDTQNAATEEPRTPILPSSTASEIKALRKWSRQCEDNNISVKEFKSLFQATEKYLIAGGLTGTCSGLGNQMFRFAGLYGIGKPYGRIPIFLKRQNCHRGLEAHESEGVDEMDRLFPNYAKYLKFSLSTFVSDRPSETRVLKDFASHCCRYDDPKRINFTSFAEKFVSIEASFFQSYKFFHNIRREIRQIFQFGRPICVQMENFKKAFFSVSDQNAIKLCVHTRIGDFAKSAAHFPSEKIFTEKAIEFTYKHLTQKHQQPVAVVLFGEDKNFLANLSIDRKLIRSIYTPKAMSRAEDLVFVSITCDSMLITSPSSTFSWWMAYLMPDGATVFYSTKLEGTYYTRENFLPEWIPLKLKGTGTIAID
uniref:Endonuclease/exonuclease/phosphatase domain-containing protein n=1 Tax=Globodera rostochiensis TaxID=31243 RepID=A0A914I3Z6_GLORO